MDRLPILILLACLFLSACGGGAIEMGGDPVTDGVHEAAVGVRGDPTLSNSEHYSMEQRFGSALLSGALKSRHYQIDAGR